MSMGGFPLEWTPTRAPHAAMLPARAGIGVMRPLFLPCVPPPLGARRGCCVEGRVAPRLGHPRHALSALIHAAVGGRAAPPARVLGCLQRAPRAEESQWTIRLPAATMPS
jgi:hypothetical protein